MNHQKIYDAIISNAKLENRVKYTYYFRKKSNFKLSYYESHHILPKCLNGTDADDNKVLLTPREHYLCHKLLTYIYVGNRKLTCAFHYMTYSKKFGKIVSARDYKYATELHKNTPISEETKKKQNEKKIGRKRNPCSKETKEKIRKGNKGKSKNKGKKLKPFSDEHKLHISKAKKGVKLGKNKKHKTLSNEHKLKLSERLKGRKKPIRSKEHCKNISKANIGRKHTDIAKLHMSESHIGKTRTKEHCKNISESLKGKKLSEEHKKSISNTLKNKNK